MIICKLVSIEILNYFYKTPGDLNSELIKSKLKWYADIVNGKTVQIDLQIASWCYLFEEEEWIQTKQPFKAVFKVVLPILQAL